MRAWRKICLIITLALVHILCLSCRITEDDVLSPTIGRPPMEDTQGINVPLASVAQTPGASTGGYTPAEMSKAPPAPEPTEPELTEPEPTEPEPTEPERNLVKLTISAVGDIALSGSHFREIFRENDSDYTYYLRNVRHIFDEDDLTLGNLECVLTDSTVHKEKTYIFYGAPHMAKILSSSGVDAVSISNNHSLDFFERGYNDTVASLEAEGVGYFGNAYITITEVKGIRVGLFGLTLWDDSQTNKNKISAAIKDLQSRDAQLIIAFYHWGLEYGYMPEKYERNLAHYSVDNGVDLVLASHPHVLRGIETYNGKKIVYSLGNFCFGGNRNPADKDSYIFQQTFTFEDDVLIDEDTDNVNVIPVRVTSVKSYNNYQPTPAEGEEAERILARVEEYSSWLVTR